MGENESSGNHGPAEAWIETFSGRRVYPMAMTAEMVYIEDIAHALSNKCRYGGHSAVFYSVAQHSVLVAEMVSPANALWALLHDAAEAYLPDVQKGVKPWLKGFAELEAHVERAVAEAFELALPMPEEVCLADREILVSEARELMPSGGEGWDLPAIARDVQLRLPGIPEEMIGWPPRLAEGMFLAFYRDLRSGGQRAGWKPEKDRVCRECGCTYFRACVTPDGPCSWVEEDLCSACVGK